MSEIKPFRKEKLGTCLISVKCRDDIDLFKVLVESYQFLGDYTPLNFNDKYGNAGSDPFCYFNYRVLIDDNLLVGNFNNFGVTGGTLQGIPIVSRLGTRYAMIQFEVKLNPGTGGIGITLPSFSYPNYTTYNCELLPPPLLVDSSTYTFKGPINLHNEYSVLVKFNISKRADSAYQLVAASPFKCTPGTFFNFNTLVVICSLKNIDPNTANGPIPKVNITISDPFGRSNSYQIPNFLNAIQEPAKIIAMGFSSLTPTYMNNFFYWFKVENNAPLVEVVLYNTGQTSGSIPKRTHIVLGNKTYREVVYTIPGIPGSPTATYEYCPFYYTNNNIGILNASSTTKVTYNIEIIQNIKTFSPQLFQEGGDILTLYQLVLNIQNLTDYKTDVYIGSIYNQYFKFGMTGQNQGVITILATEYTSLIDISGSSYTATAGHSKTDTTPPNLTQLTIKPLNNMTMALTMSSNDNSGILKLTIGDHITIDSSDMFFGSIGNGLYQKVVDYSKFISYDTTVVLYDIAGNTMEFSSEYLNISFPGVITNNYNYLEQYTSLKISYIRFMIGGGESNAIDLSDIGCQNKLYVNFTSVDKNMVIRFALDTYTDNLNTLVGLEEVFYGYWDEKVQMYTVDFDLKAREFTGIIPYLIYYPDLYFYSHDLQYMGFDDSAQLYVQSDFADRMPPIIKSVMAIPSITPSITQDSAIGWIMQIVENHNGFKRGTVVVRSNLTPQDITFELTPESLDINGNFSLFFTVKQTCIDQQFYIYSMELEDNSGVISSYESGMWFDGINPLLIVMNSPQLVISISCTPVIDINPPTLVNISQSTNSIDMSSQDRSLTVLFSVSDNNGIKNDNLPECVVTGYLLEQITTYGYIKAQDSTSALFQCEFEFPFGFAAAGTRLVYSIYGIYDNLLNVAGFPTQSLLTFNTLNPVGSVAVSFTKSKPFIESVSPLSNMGGQFTIYGKNFLFSSNQILIVSIFKDEAMSDRIDQQAFNNSDFYITMVGLNTTFNNLTSVWVVVGGSSYLSLPYKVDTYPIRVIPPTSLPPTKTCPGTPQCGGSSNGVCDSTNGVCRCINSWYGVDCLSRTVIVQPDTNTTNPDIDTDFNTTLPNGEQVTLKTLISLVSLQEMKPDGTIEKQFNFTQWVYTNTTGLSTVMQESTYKTNVTSTANSSCTVVAILQYYTEKTSIYFANEKLELLPSTLKYKIEITRFPFKSKLNTLKLVMSASIQSTSPNISCSTQESGEIDSGSEYVKLQVDTHSLYGRFIKRGIIDNRIQTLSNTITNEQTGKESMSLISINIPNFQSKAILDPDFSVLIDTTPASDKSESTCSEIEDIKNNKDGLTKSQIAGIIIGVVGFTAIVVVSVSYHFYKKHKTQKYNKNLVNKLQNFQTNK
ncbi:EGF-like domain-containing protein [Tieghemostelium lacteum]|uniref:EGF-like domain-containing protein n=1 Tax=Tieghemostelium lacteum TaxID=361077 RepID=A0A151Z7S6_TIELA|nr:EGF-like domain-containing protein [Tieghemostelium lacteum]|eukprot:KYQ90019.1 EGF-like domain-containing protein [Tieghemostelium lacteum]